VQTLTLDGTHDYTVTNDCTIGDGTGSSFIITGGSALSVGGNIGGSSGTLTFFGRQQCYLFWKAFFSAVYITWCWKWQTDIKWFLAKVFNGGYNLFLIYK